MGHINRFKTCSVGMESVYYKMDVGDYFPNRFHTSRSRIPGVGFQYSFNPCISFSLGPKEEKESADCQSDVAVSQCSNCRKLQQGSDLIRTFHSDAVVCSVISLINNTQLTDDVKMW